jgi:uncharacterized protein YggE
MTTSITPTLPGSRVGWLAVGALVGIVAAALLAPALAPRPTTAVDESGAPEHTIGVTGTGRVVLVPDTADLRIGVMIQRPTVQAARAAAAESMNKVIAALRKAGIAERDIQTSTLTLGPVYDYSPTGAPPKITGYQLTNIVAVTVRDLDRLGDAIDDSLAVGATTLEGVSFRVENSAKAAEEARKGAMADAKAKADTLAAAAGVSIVGVSTISESVSPVPYPIPYAEAGGAKDATPVLPGTTEISVTVSIAYLID